MPALFLAGRSATSAQPLAVRNPWNGAAVESTWLGGEAEFENATQAAVAAAPVMRAMPAHQRAAILSAASRGIAAQRDELARVIASEAGKPIREAAIEVDRATMTFQIAAEEAKRIGGEVIPMDVAPHGAGRFALTKRFPIGPIAAISPFNFPLNLSAHKVAPAIAAGNPLVLKPATKTPLSALRMAGILRQAGLPDGALSVVPMPREIGDRLVTDERYKLLTFTGSSAVGWRMKARAGKKRVILELGGNAPVIVDETADLDFATARIAAGGYSFAGQSCISVQRVLVNEHVFDRFAERLVAKVDALRVGDPLDPATDVGPMIEEDEAARIESWVAEAVQSGGRVLTGGRRLGPSVYAPTVLADVPSTSKVCAQEAFAPIVALSRFAAFEDAVAEANRTAYGLQAGVFTADLERAMVAFDGIETGGLLINDVPTFRVDHMPYGGVKDSGLGREGPRYTIEEMTELKLLIINRAR
jgi:acyl-CoA reductase-like NAD-dependent aldehyde dehydrogenase